jgi:hypothetical protein
MPRIHTIPGPEYATGYEALVDMAAASSVVHGAVAFVTSSGVRVAEQIFVKDGPQVQLVARGAPITEPAALASLADLGVEVSAVVGARASRFHPKLWLGEGGKKLRVLTGSGNLTEGGLDANDEQFEYLLLTSEDRDLIAQHKRRFQRFADLAVPLEAIRGTPYWREWETQNRRREAIDIGDEQLVKQGDAAGALAQMYEDLVDLYERTKAEVRIPLEGGGDRPYVASRFKRAIDRAQKEGGLTSVVARLVKNPTEGFHHLANANRPDLMIETLVHDESKSYHHLFSETAVEHARATMERYRSEAEADAH